MFRILLLCEYPTLNGGEQSMLAALDELQRQSPYELIVAVPAFGRLANEIGIRGWPLISLGNPSEAGWSQNLERAVRAHQPALVHANSLSMSRNLGRISSQLPVPCTGHLRDIVRLSRAAISDLNNLAGMAAVSDATRLHHVQQGLSADRTVTIYNGIDLNRFQPGGASNELKAELGLPPESRIALTIGQICLRKGLDTIAFAAAILGTRLPRLHWVLCGERYSSKQESVDYDDSLTTTFARAGMTQRFHRLGFQSDISRLLNSADLLVHAARQEPLGRVLLEAAASRLPIVATNVGGTREILSDGVSALLVPPNDPERLAEAVADTVLNRPSALLRAQAARVSIESQFSIATAARNLETFWKSILASNSSTWTPQAPDC